MRKIFALTLSSLPLFAEGNWINGCCTIKDHYSTNIDYMYLRRSRLTNHTIVEEEVTVADVIPQPNPNLIPFDPNSLVPISSLPVKKVMNTEDLLHKFHWESGVRATLSYTSNGYSAVEISYFYIWPWNGMDSVVGPGTLFYPFDDLAFTTDFVHADQAVATYSSLLQGAELNYVYHQTPLRSDYWSFSWIAGGRFFLLHERFNLAFSRGPNTSDYSIKTSNRLYGLQLGATIDYNPSSRWTWHVMAKGAVFFTVAKNRVFLGDENNTVTLQQFNDDRWEGTYMFEGIASLGYRLFSTLYIHAGYQGLVLDNVALAPQQVERRTPPHKRVKANGALVIDGAFAGIEYAF